MPAKLGLLAGAGDLAPAVAHAAHISGRPLYVLGFEGQTPKDWIGGYEHGWVRLGAVSRTFDLLHGAGCEEVCMIGRVGRPSLAALALDHRARGMLARLGGLDAGDDKLLRLIVSELESEGFKVVGADDIMGGLLAPVGAIAGPEADAAAEADIERGVAVARKLGEVDVGQAVVVQNQLVLGVEAAEGTDALLQRVAHLRRAGPGGVLVKGRKIGQDRRVDLPTIGPDTVTGAAAAGLRGIAVEGRHTLLAQVDELRARAEAAGIFVRATQPWA